MEITPDKIRKLEDFAAHYNIIKAELDVVNEALGQAIQQRDSVELQVAELSAVLSYKRGKIVEAESELVYQTRLAQDRKRDAAEYMEAAFLQHKIDRKNKQDLVDELKAEKASLSDEIMKYRDILSSLALEEDMAKESNGALREINTSLVSEIEQKRNELRDVETEIHSLLRKRSSVESAIDEGRAEVQKLLAEADARRANMRLASEALLEREKDLAFREDQLLIRENRYKAAMQRHFPNVAV